MISYHHNVLFRLNQHLECCNHLVKKKQNYIYAKKTCLGFMSALSIEYLCYIGFCIYWCNAELLYNLIILICCRRGDCFIWVLDRLVVCIGFQILCQCGCCLCCVAVNARFGNQNHLKEKKHNIKNNFFSIKLYHILGPLKTKLLS